MRLKKLMRDLASAGWLRWLLTGIIVVVAAVLTVQHKEIVTDGIQVLGSAKLEWVIISIVAIFVSLFAMAEVMRLLFRAAKVNVNRRMSNGLTLAANAWSVTVPGGAAFSTAMQIRRQLQWGASPVVVSWFIAFSGTLSFLGLAFLGLGSFIFIGREGAQWPLVSVAVAVLAATFLLWWLSQSPHVLRGIGLWGLKVFNKLRRQAPEKDADKVDHTLDQMKTVDVPLYMLGVTFFWSLMNWVADVVCLYACVRAVGVDKVSLTAVLLAFVSGKLVGFVQATPGGVGPVEALLTGTLVAAAHLTGAQAFASVLIYRIVSFVLVAIVGWIIYLLRFDHQTNAEQQSAEQ